MNKNKISQFIAAFIINSFLYGLIIYFLDIFEYPKEFWFNVVFFGIFNAIFQVLILPRFNKYKNKKQ